MTAEDISSTISIAKDITPNLNVMMDVIRVVCTENDDWIDMSNYGYTTLYMAISLDTNAAEACTIDGTKVVYGAGGTGTITTLVIGV